jgi:hypothetical protein
MATCFVRYNGKDVEFKLGLTESVSSFVASVRERLQCTPTMQLRFTDGTLLEATSRARLVEGATLMLSAEFHPEAHNCTPKLVRASAQPAGSAAATA